MATSSVTRRWPNGLTELIVISFVALAANKRRSFLTNVGIITCIRSVVTIHGLGNGIKAATVKNHEALTQGQQTAEITFNPNSSGDAERGFKESERSLRKQTAPDKIQKAFIKHEKLRHEVMGQLAKRDTTMSVTLVNKTKPNVRLTSGSGFNQDSLQALGQDALISNYLANYFFHGNSRALHSSLILGTKSYNTSGVFSPPKSNYRRLLA